MGRNCPGAIRINTENRVLPGRDIPFMKWSYENLAIQFDYPFHNEHSQNWSFLFKIRGSNDCPQNVDMERFRKNELIQNRTLVRFDSFIQMVSPLLLLSVAIGVWFVLT